MATVDINPAGLPPFEYQQASVGRFLVYTDADPGTGTEPHVYDPVFREHYALDVNPGVADSYAHNFVTAGSKLFFLADGPNGNVHWIDSTEGQPQLHTLEGTSVLREIKLVGDRLYFADHGAMNWIDTTLAAPVLHTLNFSVFDPYDMQVVGNELHFFEVTGQHQYSWYWFDTTLDQPTLQTIDVPVGDYSVPFNLIAAGNRLFYAAEDS